MLYGSPDALCDAHVDVRMFRYTFFFFFFYDLFTEFNRLPRGKYIVQRLFIIIYCETRKNVFIQRFITYFARLRVPTQVYGFDKKK